MTTYINLIGTTLFCSIAFYFQIFAQTTLESTDIINILEKYGSVIGILGAFVYWTWAREQRMAKRIDSLENYINEKLVTVIKNTTDTLFSNMESTKVINTTLEQFSQNMVKLSIESTSAMSTTLSTFSDAITKLSNETRKLNVTIKKSPCLLITPVEREDLEKRRIANIENESQIQ
mgnify:CR=1 FL=1